MSFYGNRLPDFVKAHTEVELRNKLAKISLGIGEKLEIVNIYHRNSFVYAWYFLDIQKAGKLPPDDDKVIKKTKKRTKKTSN